jgi:hypothetical protein
MGHYYRCVVSRRDEAALDCLLAAGLNMRQARALILEDKRSPTIKSRRMTRQRLGGGILGGERRAPRA